MTLALKEQTTQITYNQGPYQRRIVLGIPSTGVVRLEWAIARYGQIIPVNWGAQEAAVMFSDQLSPIGYLVHDARNMIVEATLNAGAEWLIFIDHDVILPPDCFLKLTKYIEEGKYPVVSGLYWTKSEPAEPLLFRGRGNGAFHDWTLGEKVWVDGIPMGCALIHASLLRVMWEASEIYPLPDGRSIRKVFDTPRNRFFDPETGLWNTELGTEDLWWCDRVIKENVLGAAGFAEIAKRKYPFLVDTSIHCSHIDTATGRRYPG